MLAAERHALLLTRLARDGKLVAKDIATELHLSPDSIRRDLRELAAAGLCQRVYGGALPVSAAIADYATRAGIEVASKDQLAQAAVRLIDPGSTVILDGGTTNLAVARALPPDLFCTVITHSPTIASALLDHSGIEVIILGGRLFKHSAVTCGAAAMEAAQTISADLFLLGVAGVHASEGLTTGDVEEAAMKRALASRAAETYALASTEKVGAMSRFRILPFEQLAGIVTNHPAHDPTLLELQELGVAIINAAS